MTKEKVRLVVIVAIVAIIFTTIAAFASYEKYYRLTSISGNSYSIKIDEEKGIKATPFSLSVVTGEDEVGINLLSTPLYDAIKSQIKEGDYDEYTKYLGGYTYECYFDGSYFTYLRPINPGDYISISSTNEEKLDSVCDKIKISLRRG